jgi:hypothetical protein
MFWIMDCGSKLSCPHDNMVKSWKFLPTLKPYYASKIFFFFMIFMKILNKKKMVEAKIEWKSFSIYIVETVEFFSLQIKYVCSKLSHKFLFYLFFIFRVKMKNQCLSFQIYAIVCEVYSLNAKGLSKN